MRGWRQGRYRGSIASAPSPARRSRRLAALGGALLAGTAPGAVLAAEVAPLSTAFWTDPQGVAGFAIFLGLVIFSTTTAILHLRQRGRWMARERMLNAELEQLRDAKDRAALLLGSERQLIVSWSGRAAEPRFEGDPTVAGEGAVMRRVLAFGTWLAAADAATLESAVERLRERGEGFSLTARRVGRGHVEVEGRTVGGAALLRLRDVTGDRADLLSVRAELGTLQNELKALRTVLDAIPQPVWLRDAESRLAWANQAYLDAVEAPAFDEAQRRGLELLDAGSRADAHRHRLAGERYGARVAAVVAGQRRILDVTEAPSAGGSAGIAIDVSELEAVRADLQRQMQAHVRTLDQLPTAVAMFDAKQRLIFHNAAYRQLWTLDQTFLDARPSDGEILDRLRTDRKLPEQADFRSWKTGVLSAYRALEPQETWWHLPDRRTLRVVSNPNPQGGLTYLFDDVSERVRLESQYNTLIRVQGETLDTLKEGVAVFGSDGRLKLSNRAFADLWRLAPDTLADQPHIDAVIRFGRELAPVEEPWIDLRGAVAGLPEARMGLTTRIERRDGSVLEAAAQPLPDGATLLTFIDMTASVNVERALLDRNDALEKAARLRDDFVHHVSYELRSPLTNIIGFTQLLGDETVGPLNPRQKEYAGHIMRSSGALLAIINDILDLASVDTGVMELACEAVDIRQTIEAAVRGVADRLAESALSLEIDAPPELGAFAADAKRVRQVLFNLLSNAIGFSSPGQTIRVQARRGGGEVSFAVQDEGRGMPPEVKARVFDRFESHTLGTRHRGVGLGLSIVRSFVELHGGRVELQSSPGAGTTVTCIFPDGGAPTRLAAE
ncbi:MAG TPA: PAS-domain containing protein [Beijerinckiaceae bacterium]